MITVKMSVVKDINSTDQTNVEIYVNFFEKNFFYYCIHTKKGISHRCLF